MKIKRWYLSIYLALLSLTGVSAHAEIGGEAIGIYNISSITCDNKTTGQRVRTAAQTDMSWDCAAGGFMSAEGDVVRQYFSGRVDSSRNYVGGRVLGMSKINAVRCYNRNTRQRIVIRNLTSMTWNCEAAGLRVRTDQAITQMVYGVAQGQALFAPSGLSAQAGVSEVTLTWNTVTNAIEYNVYMSSSPNVIVDSANLITTTAQNTATIGGLSNATEYYFIVTALNGSVESAASQEVSAIPGFFDHGTVIGQSCASAGCHDGMGTTSGKPPLHPLTTNLCEACHGTNAWLPILVPFDHSQSVDACAASGCHSIGGSGVYKSPTHPLTTDLCDACHTTQRWDQFLLPFDHSQTSDACENCHNGVISIGKPATHVATDRPCDVCHNTQSWLTVAFDHSTVAGLSCSSAGCHDGNSSLTYKPSSHPITSDLCDVCHQSTAWLPIIFPFDHSQAFDECQACHNGLIASGKPATHLPTSLDCGACHNTNGWLFLQFDHSTVAGLACASNGCHDGVSGPTSKPADHPITSNLCETCHISTNWLTLVTPFAHNETVSGCADGGCHNGVSGRRYKPANHPATTDSCGACHITTQWLPLIYPFDHGQITTNRCSDCHNGGIAQGLPANHISTLEDCGVCHVPTSWLQLIP